MMVKGLQSELLFNSKSPFVLQFCTFFLETVDRSEIGLIFISAICVDIYTATRLLIHTQPIRISI